MAQSHGIVLNGIHEPWAHRIAANGLEFRYLDWGGDGPAILFLHGGGQNARTWDLVCAQLHSRYHCYALDLRGHGESGGEHLQRNDLQTHAGDVREVVSELGLSRVALVGMSLGGLTMMHYAPDNPPELAAAVFVDVAPTTRNRGREAAHAFARGPMEFDSFEAVLEEAMRINPYRPRLHHEYGLRFSFTERADGKWVRKRHIDNPPAEMNVSEAQRSQLARDWEAMWKAVARIQCPALVVRGGESLVIYDEDLQRFAEVLPKGRRITIPGASHTVQGDKPKPLAEALIAFFDEVGY